MSLTKQERDFLMAFEQSEDTRIQIADVANDLDELTYECIVKTAICHITKNTVNYYEDAINFIPVNGELTRRSLCFELELDIKLFYANNETIKTVEMQGLEIIKWDRLADEIMSAWEARKRGGSIIMGLTKQEHDFLMEFGQPKNTRIDITDIADALDELTRDCIIDVAATFISESSIIYYTNGIDYLAEHDASLKISLSMCSEFGIELDDVDSELLANLLMQKLELAEWEYLADEIMTAWEARKDEENI